LALVEQLNYQNTVIRKVGQVMVDLEGRVDQVLNLMFLDDAQDRGPTSSKVILTVAVTTKTSRWFDRSNVPHLKNNNNDFR